MGTENYTLGKGSVFFTKYNTTSEDYEAERNLGNCPEFSFSIALEKLEHFSSQSGLRAKDKEVISKITPSVSFTLDELSAENMSLLTLANITTVSQVAASHPESEETVVAGLVKIPERGITNLVVVTSLDAAMTLGADYTFDDHTSTITVLNAEATIKIAYDFPDADYKILSAISETEIIGKLKFVSDNAVGNQQELIIHSISLTPAGDTAMIGDDWSTLSFSGEILKSDAAVNASSPYFDIIVK